MVRLDCLRGAMTALQNGKPEQAEYACRQLVDRDTADIEAWLLLGLALGLRGDASAAASVLDTVARARRNYAHPCRDLAKLLLDQGKASLIAPQYRACLALAPNDLRLCFPFAEFLRESGGAAEAIYVLEPLLHLYPTNAEAHDQLGLALADAGRFAEAAERFRQADRVGPRTSSVLGKPRHDAESRGTVRRGARCIRQSARA